MMLQEYIEGLAAHGLNAQGGVDRPVYSAAWLAAREQLRAWMETAGLVARVDAAGNLFGRLEGSEPGTILTGSHLDTVPNGGKLDGALGIVAGLVALQSLAGRRPRKALEVVALCEEEGSRFPANFWGSRAITGMVGESEPADIRDANGVAIGEVMASIGLMPSSLQSARRSDIEAFLELHIEQGPVLEAEGMPLGLVTSITGQHRAVATVTGRPDHAGTTPMAARNDALVAAAEMVLGIHEAALELGAPAVATVGQIQVRPGAMNVVPGRVTFSLDARHPDSLGFSALVGVLEERCGSIASRRGVGLQWERVMRVEPQAMDGELVSVLAEAAADLGIPGKRMHSGAGHDSQIFASAVPTAMLFVPSRHGRSHSPAEFTAVEDIEPGVRVLTRALERLAFG